MVSRIQRRPHDLGEDEEQEGEQDRQVRVRRLLLKVDIRKERPRLNKQFSLHRALIF